MAARVPTYHLVDADDPDRAPLATQVARADTFLTRLRGLLGRDGLGPDEGLWIEPCDSVHMLFMKFPIDVAFLDRSGRVIAGVPDLRPWRVTKLYPGARVALELPAGTLKARSIGVGRRLVLREPAANPGG